MYKKILLGIITVLIILIQLYLISVQPINAVNMPYDDNLMIEQAKNILAGKWLGEYNCLTLVKGVFTPIFIAFSHILHIPFLIAQDIFYILACFTLIFVLRKKIKSKIIALLGFTFLIFHPIIYSLHMCRVYRDGLYMSLIIYLLAFTIRIIFKSKRKF